jgi:hypothetical protein
MARVPLEDHVNIVKLLLSYPGVNPNQALPTTTSVFWCNCQGPDKVSALLDLLIEDKRTDASSNAPLRSYVQGHSLLFTEEMREKLRKLFTKDWSFY